MTSLKTWAAVIEECIEAVDSAVAITTRPRKLSDAVLAFELNKRRNSPVK